MLPLQTSTIQEVNQQVHEEKAVKIQSLFRGYRVRKIVNENFLPKQLRAPCNALLFRNLLEAMPQADSGDSDVYFPDQIPNVVLKEPAISQKPSCTAYFRLRLMCHARKLCQLNGFNSLVIPKARLSNSQKFIFEERLPFNSNFIEQERLATVHSQDKAIKQFTRFVLETGMWDIVLNYRQIKDDFPLAKRDNFPLYLNRTGETETVHIGLVDLEHISTKKTESNHKLLLQLVYVFPNSFHLILAEAREYGIKESLLEELHGDLIIQHNLGLLRNKLWHTDLIAYMDNKRAAGMDVKTLVDSKLEMIFNEMVNEFKIPENAMPEFRAYLVKFCSILVTLLSKDISYNSVYGEKHRLLNTAYFDIPSCS